MKKIICAVSVLLASLLLLCSCSLFESAICEHEWESATCETPQTCTKCGAVTGEALGHDFQVETSVDVTCTTDGSKTMKCSRCGQTKTEVIQAQGHQWTEATCTEPKTCSVCNITEGEPLGHIGDDVCRRCGEKLLPYHKAGMYLVGQDIAAGEYYVKAQSGSCYVEIASDTSGNLQSIIANENIQGFGYVTLQSGQYFTITNGLFIETESAPIAQRAAGVYSAGMYKIGRDIPAGEYYVYTYTDLCYLEVASSSSHRFKDIVCNETADTYTYITVREGEYLTVNRGVFVPIEDAKRPVPENGKLPSGTYKVGQDIPAGEYKIGSNNDRNAYFEIATDSRHVLSSIVQNGNFNGERYVTVEDGQYLTITNGYIVYSEQ